MKLLRISCFVSVLLLAGIAVTPAPADAQLDRIRRAAQRSLTDRFGRAMDNAVLCAVGDDRCVEKAKEEGKTPVFEDEEGNVITDEDGNPITDPDDAALTQDEPGTGIWRNYDFVTGSIVWYALDLEDAVVGRIPTDQIEYVKGNIQTVEKDGQKVLECSAECVFRVPMPENLPERFTFEFDYSNDASGFAVKVATGPLDRGSFARSPYHYPHIWRSSSITGPEGVVSSLDAFQRIDGEFVHFAIQVDRNAGRDDDYVVGYGGFERFAQVPNATFDRGDFLEFHMDGNANLRTYIKNIVVAVKPEAPLELALIETGEFTTRGLLFDFNSARLRPESTPTLNEILRTLNNNPEVRLAIEGHTDSSGEEDYNLTLSEQRAQSVVEYLVDQGVDEGRLTPVGRGEVEPVGDNDTEAGRQQNRRVVLKVIDATH